MTSSAPYDIYRNIHKALRAYTADTMVRLGRVDHEDTEELTAVLAQVRELATFTAGHLFHEDRFVHPAMESRAPGSSKDCAGEHEHHDHACRKLISLAASAVQASVDERPLLIKQLYQQLNVFFAESLVHMHAEETENNAVLWATHSDAELAAIEQALVASLTPEEKGIGFRWMIPALNPQERAQLLAGVRRGVPAPVFEGMLGQVRGLLTEREWAKLATALQLEVKLAA